MSSVESDIIEIIAEKANVARDKITRESTMEDLEIESLDVVEIVFALEEKFDIEIPYNANDQEQEFSTVGDVIEAVQGIVEKG